MKKILHLSPSDTIGGSSIATYRLHKALLKHPEINSKLLVDHKSTDDPSVVLRDVKHSYLKRRLRDVFISFKVKSSKHPQNQPLSIAWLKTNILNHQLLNESDIIQLHWIGDHLISIEEIGKINKPMVWRLADMWPFLGCEHYSTDSSLTQSASAFNGDKVSSSLSNWTFHRKKYAWINPIHIVCTTDWMRDCVRKSELMHNWPAYVIPNCIDTEIFRPHGQLAARKILNLPVESRIILFGAIGGLLGDPRKGGDLALEALSKLTACHLETDNLIFLTFGSSNRDSQESIGSNGASVIHSGRISDEIHLSLLYSACDVMVVPSRQESFGQTAIEAQACGAPVISFRIGGLQNLIIDGFTGHLCDAFDTNEMAIRLASILSNSSYRQFLSRNCRINACRLWSEEQVAKQYNTLYQSILPPLKNHYDH